MVRNSRNMILYIYVWICDYNFSFLLKQHLGPIPMKQFVLIEIRKMFLIPWDSGYFGDTVMYSILTRIL
jgi:hypothetical protein